MNKETLRQFIPDFLLRLHWKYYKSRLSELKKMETDEVFTFIYKNNYWGTPETASGDGSTLSETENISKQLPILVNDLGISSILDIPCGDFYWMKNVNLTGIKYTGGDIVKDIIASNKEKFEGVERTFENLDLTKDKLPTVDIIFCRDCLVHLSNDKIAAALRNIRNSGSKYLLTTHYLKERPNKDIVTGDWRSINFLLPPYNFPKPFNTILDTVPADGKEYSDKVMALWRIDDLPNI
jgi:2-polyprenyl-3-methyl-5-hydroxy-6-metoxy-1,4-benzoquinol methylase